MKCSVCGGNVISTQHLVYFTNGSSSGTYCCQDCGRTKNWFIQGNIVEEIIDMEDKK